MAEVRFKTMINSKETEIVMEDDPAWYKVETLFKAYFSGTDKADPAAFLVMLVKTFVTSGINSENPTEIKSLRGTEFTKLIGEIVTRSPLAQYMENLSPLATAMNMELPKTQLM
jgi:hypothetical protein